MLSYTTVQSLNHTGWDMFTAVHSSVSTIVCDHQAILSRPIDIKIRTKLEYYLVVMSPPFKQRRQ